MRTNKTVIEGVKVSVLLNIAVLPRSIKRYDGSIVSENDFRDDDDDEDDGALETNRVVNTPARIDH